MFGCQTFLNMQGSDTLMKHPAYTFQILETIGTSNRFVRRHTCTCTAFKTEQHTLILRTIPTTHFKQNAQISFGKVKSDSDIVKAIENEQDV